MTDGRPLLDTLIERHFEAVNACAREHGLHRKGARMSVKVVVYCTGRLALASLDFSAPGRHRHEDGTLCGHPGPVAWARQVIEVPAPLVARAGPIEIMQAD